MNYEDQVTKEYVEGLIPRIVTGTYAGNDETSQTITLPFTPKAVLVCPREANMQATNGEDFYLFGGLIAPGQPLYQNPRYIPILTEYDTVVAAEVTDHGFIVYANVDGVGYSNLRFYNHMNKRNLTFQYLAIG